MAYQDIYAFCSLIIMTISVLLCLLVIYLSYRIYSVNRRREYTWIMGFNALVDIVYSLALGIVATCGIATHDQFFLTVENPLLQDMHPFFLHVAIFLVSLMTLAIAPCNTVHFYYRYCMICKDVLWSKRKYFFLYLAALSYLTINGVVFHFSGTADTAESRRSLEEMQGRPAPRHFVTRQDDPLFMLCVVNCQIIFTVEYGIIIFCGVRIILKMREKVGATASSTRRAQKYVIIVMMLQAAYPLILYFIPIMYLTSMVGFGGQINDVSYMGATSIQLLPALNSLSVLTMLPSYRRAFLHNRHLETALTMISET
uniref:G_PROTEIN_RECEP_F1_2 domain-containing protein n=2 Tax=Bursaphelenchus xylophilus TaxID=6326 RepID=A0A1I7SC88_BURXY